jgi:23S rRNA (pseudouridine1915-N3)-methyltransferase
MRITFIFSGKKGSVESDTLIEEYRTRVGHSYDTDIRYLSSSKKGDEVLRDESERILSEIDETDYVLLCDERGKQMTSPEYSDVIARLVSSGKKRVVIIVGGAYGVTDGVRARADMMLALSRMVFPHEIARIMILEQTYRGLSIIAGSRYHHA